MAVAEKIPLETIESTMISGAGYNPAKHILAVQFTKSATIKHYAGITPEMAAEFYAAESKGRFLAARVFNKFAVERMTGPCSKCGAEGWIGEMCDDCGTDRFAPAPEKERAHGDRDAD